LHVSVTGWIEHVPQLPLAHVCVPAAHGPERPAIEQLRVAVPVHAQSDVGFAVPSQFSSSIVLSHCSVAPGFTDPLLSLQSTLPVVGARLVWFVGQPPTAVRPVAAQLCTAVAPIAA
jgi:hypothetical protein